MAGWTGKRSNVMYSRPEEPSFLKKFKERVGYKEDGGLSAKFKHLEEPIVEEYVENDDELPQVVCLKPGDISQEEYDKLRTEENIADASSEKLVVQGPQLEEEVPDPNDGKILFRKPAKRSSEDGERVRDGKKKHRNTEGKRNRDGKRHKSSEEKKDGEEKKHKEKRREKQKKELLSFNQEEEDENE
ncbi:hypothetical protein SK128_028486 [Halocaridina rubra]|uniref:DUF4604 domain-containing protein n=1 Tax=Halocaridina rubra TaxID=373956 RepID=A0AAN8ZZ25_HALRR